ncbi:UNVERIFIED_CONTAM: DNA-3-methyladenine glycosylase 1 [Sesamum radiatum]|uniref:DNA-3-methyladenine glycosylase 1 n=1 Tax=Sesamum radiatum TaxID=300843 RepID=A0AAW2V647_SESRA
MLLSMMKNGGFLSMMTMFISMLLTICRKLFELLSFSTALAELTWPVILSKRPIFRDVFLDFDPIAVSKLNDKKIATQGSPASSLLSELKLRAIIENARQICKIIDEVGSFDKYIWGFVNYKPIVGNFRYPRQVPIKTSKADTISKDLVRRGFRGVGPTVVYSFMQVAGITNDHLINCFRYQDCIVAGDDLRDKNEGITPKNEENPPEDLRELELVREIDDLNLSR